MAGIAFLGISVTPNLQGNKSGAWHHGCQLGMGKGSHRPGKIIWQMKMAFASKAISSLSNLPFFRLLPFPLLGLVKSQALLLQNCNAHLLWQLKPGHGSKAMPWMPPTANVQGLPMMPLLLPMPLEPMALLLLTDTYNTTQFVELQL